MQTFMPLRGFKRSAAVLDSRRLSNQVNEATVILKTLTGVYAREGRRGWPHHPATKMWQGYETALISYRNACIQEATKRGTKLKTEIVTTPVAPKMPWWYGDESFHRSHRSALLRKQPKYYRQFWADERDDLPYVWPKRGV